MEIKAILFDLDGTLTDSCEGIIKSVQYALHSFGIKEENIENLKRFVGPPLREGFKEFYQMDDEAAELATAKYRERYLPIGVFENQVFDGVYEMLEGLKKAGFSLHIATSKPQVIVQTVLEHFHLTDYFTHIVGASMDGSFGEKPEVIAEVVRRLQLPKEACIMVGDRKYDAMGAAENGLAFIGVTYSGSGAELAEYPHLLLADTPQEIVAYLTEQKDG